MNISEKINEKLGADYTVKETNILKNNGKTRHGYEIMREGANCSPVIYIPDNMTDEDEIVEFILEAYKDTRESTFNISILTDPVYICEHVFPSLVNLEKNRERFKEKNIYYIPYLDMALIYRIKVKDKAFGEGFITLTKEMIKDIDTNILIASAEENLEDFVKIDDLSDMVRMFGLNEHNYKTGVMLVISNFDRINGAAAILMDSTIDKIKKILDCDSFYVIPSSIHEVIAMKVDEKFAKDMKEIIENVNATCVSAEDFLSNNLYVYEDGMFKCV